MEILDRIKRKWTKAWKQDLEWFDKYKFISKTTGATPAFKISRGIRLTDIEIDYLFEKYALEKELLDVSEIVRKFELKLEEKAVRSEIDLFDQLPQPYRMITKIIELEIIDKTWLEIIRKHPELQLSDEGEMIPLQRNHMMHTEIALNRSERLPSNLISMITMSDVLCCTDENGSLLILNPETMVVKHTKKLFPNEETTTESKDERRHSGTVNIKSIGDIKHTAPKLENLVIAQSHTRITTALQIERDRNDESNQEKSIFSRIAVVTVVEQHQYPNEDQTASTTAGKGAAKKGGKGSTAALEVVLEPIKIKSYQINIFDVIRITIDDNDEEFHFHAVHQLFFDSFIDDRNSSILEQNDSSHPSKAMQHLYTEYALDNIVMNFSTRGDSISVTSSSQLSRPSEDGHSTPKGDCRLFELESVTDSMNRYLKSIATNESKVPVGSELVGDHAHDSTIMEGPNVLHAASPVVPTLPVVKCVAIINDSTNKSLLDGYQVQETILLNTKLVANQKQNKQGFAPSVGVASDVTSSETNNPVEPIGLRMSYNSSNLLVVMKNAAFFLIVETIPNPWSETPEGRAAAEEEAKLTAVQATNAKRAKNAKGPNATSITTTDDQVKDKDSLSFYYVLQVGKFRFSAPVSASRIDDKRQILVLGLYDGTVSLWNLTERIMVKVLGKHDHCVSSLFMKMENISSFSTTNYKADKQWKKNLYVVSGAVDGTLCFYGSSANSQMTNTYISDTKMRSTTAAGKGASAVAILTIATSLDSVELLDYRFDLDSSSIIAISAFSRDNAHIVVHYSCNTLAFYNYRKRLLIGKAATSIRKNFTNFHYNLMQNNMLPLFIAVESMKKPFSSSHQSIQNYSSHGKVPHVEQQNVHEQAAATKDGVTEQLQRNDMESGNGTKGHESEFKQEIIRNASKYSTAYLKRFHLITMFGEGKFFVTFQLEGMPNLSWVESNTLDESELKFEVSLTKSMTPRQLSLSPKATELVDFSLTNRDWKPTITSLSKKSGSSSSPQYVRLTQARLFELENSLQSGLVSKSALNPIAVGNEKIVDLGDKNDIFNPAKLAKTDILKSRSEREDRKKKISKNLLKISNLL